MKNDVSHYPYLLPDAGMHPYCRVNLAVRRVFPLDDMYEYGETLGKSVLRYKGKTERITFPSFRLKLFLAASNQILNDDTVATFSSCFAQTIINPLVAS